MARVNIEVGGKHGGFMKSMDAVEHRLEGLKHKVGFHLGGTLATLAGGATLTAMVENMTEFANEIKHAADNLGIATDRAQQLRQIARHGGKDMSVWSGIFTKVETFASKALVKGSREANIASQLGLSQEDLKHGNKDTILKKALAGTEHMDRSKQEGLFKGIVGAKAAGFVLGHKEEIQKPESHGLVSNEDIKKLAELKESWEDLIDVVRASLIPTFISVSEFLLNFIEKFSGTLGFGAKVTKTLDEEAEKQTGSKPGFFKKALWNTAAIAGQVTSWGVHGTAAIADSVGLHGAANMLTGGRSLADDAALLSQGRLTKIYGENVYNKGMEKVDKVYTEFQKQQMELERRKAERKKAHEEEEAAKNGPVNREPPVAKDAKHKFLLDKELKNNDPMLRVGGLMTRDTTYNLSRLTEKTNSLLEQIVKNTMPQNPNDDGVDMSDLLDNL